MARLLYNRGLAEPSQLELFIASDKRLSGDPFLLPDIHQAVARIYQALLSGENIAIYGDFDADGITGTALFTDKALVWLLPLIVGLPAYPRLKGQKGWGWI